MAVAYRYHRFSTKSQDKGSSIERQDEVTMGMVNAHGWTLAPGGPIEDRGRSAWKGDHLSVGNLGLFKQRVDAGEIEPGSILVIENLDRLSRENVKKARRWVEEVTEAGVLIAVAGMNKIFDEASLSGDNIVDLIQYLTEAQRSNKESQRKSEFRFAVNERHIEKAKRGEVYDVSGPRWLDLVDGRWVANPERAAVIVQMYEWCASGLGYASICRKLNAQIEPWTRGWKTEREEWKVGYVRDILTTQMVEGEFHRKAVGEDSIEIIEGYYPRIVNADLVERARAAIKGRNKTGGRYASDARNLFAGLTECGHCGGAMEKIVNLGSGGKRYYYFLCRASRAGTCDNGARYRYDLFENGALCEILHLTLDDTHFVKADETGPLIAKIAELKKERELLKGKIEILVDQLEAGLAVDAVAKRLDMREAEMRKLEADLEQAENDLAKARGKVSAEEHLRRVMEVRSAITSDDEETAQQARRMVRTAMQAMIERIQFFSERISAKRSIRTIKLNLVGMHVTIWFDGEGEVVDKRSSLETFANNNDNHVTRALISYGEKSGDVAKAAIGQQLKRARSSAQTRFKLTAERV